MYACTPSWQCLDGQGEVGSVTRNPSARPMPYLLSIVGGGVRWLSVVLAGVKLLSILLKVSKEDRGKKESYRNNADDVGDSEAR